MVHGKIQAFYAGMTGEHHRDRSWEHCYRYFHKSTPAALAADADEAALHLGFYLASWGMYRGSSFLLQYSHTVHLGVIRQLVGPQFSVLWEKEFGADESDEKLVPTVMEAIHAVREAYRPFAPPAESRQASPTLITKIMLGTFGCLPACDRYFIQGFRSTGFRYSYLTREFVERVLQFCIENLRDLREEQRTIEHNGAMRYPLMKLVDMYFWQIGCELDGRTTAPDARQALGTPSV
jgi:hypothetical protein